MIAYQVSAEPVNNASFETYRSNFGCHVVEDNDTGSYYYMEIILRNCGFVRRYQEEIEEAINDSLHEIVPESQTQRQDWLNRSTAAAAACEQAQLLLQANDYVPAASIAVNAWGSIIMRGRECCVLTRPPYCIDKDWSGAIVAIAVPFFVLVLLLVGAWLCSDGGEGSQGEPTERGGGSDGEARHAAAAAADRTEAEIMRERAEKKTELEGKLLDAWNEGSPLRVLPHSDLFASSAASLFASLWQCFDFQEASVENQFEHLLSLLRSQVAMVADRALGEGGKVEESVLLPEAIGDLHTELLDGFCRWRKKFRDHEDTNMGKKGEKSSLAKEVDPLPKLCGAPSPRIAAAGWDATEMGRQLAEISAFLLVWGEAGNLRFMPEASEMLRSNRSGLFLSRVIRPVYNMIFEEWYEKVGVKSNGEDQAKLLNGLEAYIPPHVANYDDWNEFMADPDRMVEGLIQMDQEGTRLFDYPHGQRFKQLSRVDWKLSLEACKVKTHRELHSLWGVFAAIHRVILVHTFLFFAGVIIVYDEKDTRVSPEGGKELLGQTTLVRYAAHGLLAPLHAVAWGMAQWQVTGPALRPKCHRRESVTGRYQYLRDLGMSFFHPLGGRRDSGQRRALRWLLCKPWLIIFLIPAITYGVIRYQDYRSGDYDGETVDTTLLFVHFMASEFLCLHLLLVPNYRCTENLPHVPTPRSLVRHSPLCIVRYLFWGIILFIKFIRGMVVIEAVSDAMESLETSCPGMQSWSEISKLYFTSHWVAAALQWLLFWCTNLYLFFTDTALWYITGCGFLGVLTTVAQRHFAKNQNHDTCPLKSFLFEDAVAKIPERFSEKVLSYTKRPKSHEFPQIWNHICERMHDEDKVDSLMRQDLSYNVEPKEGNMPKIFQGNTFLEGRLKPYTDQGWPPNAEIQWRITALARGLALPMPRPYRCPYMPGITVLIPHYKEAILMEKQELCRKGRNGNTPLMDWLAYKYSHEFNNFTRRMQAWAPPTSEDPWPTSSRNWDLYTDKQWRKVNRWAAMRQQTLFRTVAGVCYYHPAIQWHMDLQGDRHCSLGKVWDASDCFTCIVSMQRYAFFDETMKTHTKYMLERYKDCLKVAYIKHTEKEEGWEQDQVHRRQKRRYFSCLIDHTCVAEGDLVDSTCVAKGERQRRLINTETLCQIELPGYPILGDGKGDNQNHAIIFMRGHYAQCIDANQGAYFEQMLLLPVALAEFRSKKRGDNGGKKIIGFPEHITSDMGSIGDFAASAEVAFGTILQRTYAVLGARMHYGHPDIMNRLFMIQQGGVSKATKTINLSEDIFAGMDFTLRGDGRTIRHCEYFHMTKGRDLGFNTVMGFSSKLASGTGEQLLTRQVFRLGQVMQLPEALSFYYSHAGYYVTQFFISWALPLLVFMWLLVLVSDCDDSFTSVQHCDPDVDVEAADVMAGLMVTCYSWIMLLFIFGTMFPLFMELWMERSLGFALHKVMLSYLTMSPLFFIFQAKCIGHYVVNEFRYGGATYVATGRGLPTERRPLIGEMMEQERTVTCEPSDLRFDVDPSRGRVRSVEVDGRAKKLGILPGDLVTSIDGMPFSRETFGSMMGGTGETTIMLKWKYLKVGGLYLDYAVISHYDGATLLLGVLLLLPAGGMPSENVTSLRWIFVSLALTIIAWLWAPFIFNPYQYEAKFFWNDVKTLPSFFRQDNSRHWVEWYDRTQLKAGHGLAKTLVDITFFIFVLAVAAWYVAVDAKVQAFASVYSQYKGAGWLYVRVLVPPVVASFSFTIMLILAVLIKHRVPRLQDEVRTTMASGESVTRRLGCSTGIPLPLCAVVVAGLDVLEAGYFLRELWQVEWYKGLLAGLVLKLLLLSAVTFLLEGVLRSKKFIKLTECCEPVGRSLATWVFAHGMLRDILTAALVILPQSIIVLLNSMMQYYLCPNCNAHHLCLYRDPGHIKRREQVLMQQPEEPPTVALATTTAPPQAAIPAPTTFGRPGDAGASSSAPLRDAGASPSAPHQPQVPGLRDAGAVPGEPNQPMVPPLPWWRWPSWRAPRWRCPSWCARRRVAHVV